MENIIHQIEQDAYFSVLKAFKAQADAITWDREDLITELRKELRVSDDEHRELLARVNTDDIICRIRQWRQAGGPESSLHQSTRIALDQDRTASISTLHRRLNTSRAITPLSLGTQPTIFQSVAASQQPLSTGRSTNSRAMVPAVVSQSSIQNRITSTLIGGTVSADDPANLVGRKVMLRRPGDHYFLEAVITYYDRIKGSHTVVYDMHKPNETYEWINLNQIPPDDIKWATDEPTISIQGGGVTPSQQISRPFSRTSSLHSASRGRAIIPKFESSKDRTPLQSEVPMKRYGDIEIFDTSELLKRAEWVLNHPDITEIERVKKLLKDHELKLVDALERLKQSDDDKEPNAQGDVGDGDPMHVDGSGPPLSERQRSAN